MARKPPDFQRRKPRQSRSRLTYDSILEAAVLVLQRDGPDGMTTNRVAERAGVSIGTLYQYFPDKAAILLAAARREVAGPGFLAQRKALMEALIRMLEGLLTPPAEAAPIARGASTASRTASSETQLERRLLQWFEVLAPLPRPALIRR